MPTMADIFIRYQHEYLGRFGAGVLPSHRQVISKIISCRTRALGGSLHLCPTCERKHYSYHSCGNRHCPQCGGHAAEKWAQVQAARIPRVPCFLMTFTVPHELNRLIRSHQKDLYRLMFNASSQAVKLLCKDPRHLGAQPGMLGVLHTWGRNINYHPHIHYIIPAGGVKKNGKWVPTRYPDFLVPVKALSLIFRAKFRDGLKESGLIGLVPKSLWSKPWVVHCEAAGRGPEVIRYLSRYIRRVALGNKRIVSLKEGRVSFLYQPVGTRIWKTMSLPALAFMARFLQHVLPQGFAKIRYYGFLHPRGGPKVEAIRDQLGLPVPPTPSADESEPMLCPHCKTPLLLLGGLPRQRAPPC